ncbi:unnamed protein product, partial [marine sediment metagenome]
KFEEIKTEITAIKNTQIKQGKTLTRIDTTLTIWANNNGVQLPDES